MFGSDVMVIETPSFINRKLDNLFCPRSQPNLSQDRAVTPSDDELDS
jgi:hypothetical protein